MGLLSLTLILCTALSGCGMLGHPQARKDTGTEVKLFEQALTEFTAALDAHDADALKSIFAPNVVKNTELDDDIRKLFAFYPGQTERMDWEGKNLFGDYSNHHGSHTAIVSKGFTLFSNGTVYYCSMELMYRNDGDPGEVGVQSVHVLSEKAAAGPGFDGMDEPGLYVLRDKDVDGTYQTARVGGLPVIFEPMERRLTEEEILCFLEQSNHYADFTARFGAPNAQRNLEICPVFQLEDKDGEPRYAMLLLVWQKDKKIHTIYKVSIMDSEKELSVLWKEDTSS